MKRYIRNDQSIEELEPIVSMAKVGVDDVGKTVYYVNPDLNRIGDPYFKVYDNISHTKATHIARISFLEPRYVSHRDEAGKQPWKLNSSEKKKMVAYLNQKSGIVKTTNWIYCMYLWNNEYGFFDSISLDEKYSHGVFAYKDGFYDTDENLKHPSYLPSYLQIPDYTVL